MKKNFLFLLSILISVSAFAEPFSFSNFYVDGFGGVNFVNNKEGAFIHLNTGYLLGGNLGYRFSEFFRLEAEGAYRENGFDELVYPDLHIPVNGEVKHITLMANGMLDIPIIDDCVLSYIGFGIGERWIRNNLPIKLVKTDDIPVYFDKSATSGFAYQVIAGLSAYMSRKALVSIEYRYLDGTSMQGNHAIDLGIKRYF